MSKLLLLLAAPAAALRPPVTRRAITGAMAVAVSAAVFPAVFAPRAASARFTQGVASAIGITARQESQPRPARQESQPQESQQAVAEPVEPVAMVEASLNEVPRQRQ